VLDAESCSEGVESGNKIVQREKSAGTISLERKRPIQLGTDPMCQCHYTRSHDTRRVLDAEYSREGVESVERVTEKMEQRICESGGAEEGVQSLELLPGASVTPRDHTAPGGF